ncbi:hypothetical protein [Arthrobacter woluwensis]|uniref:Uncharacterized protein n=2 Tax=Arthrobacter woluwensis TaxID=156980 RepID=A0A1H4X0I2_9MICC|nr:hypothetical protein [Arthrobacter woluwensis]SEC99232.1 hypothetical protein SAMN04489745_3638 [Arthrobacter woluwensis]
MTSVAGRTGDVVLARTDIPAATTSAPGAMSAADKAKLNGLGTESIVSALSPAGWNVGGSIFVEPLAGETKITIALVPKYTGANVTITTTAYTSMGTVLPSAAMSSTADSPYVLTQVVGAGLNNQAIAFVNLATGPLLSAQSGELHPRIRRTVHHLVHLQTLRIHIMAQAMVSITLEGKRIDLNGDIPDDIATSIVKQITALLVGIQEVP